MRPHIRSASMRLAPLILLPLLMMLIVPVGCAPLHASRSSLHLDPHAADSVQGRPIRVWTRTAKGVATRHTTRNGPAQSPRVLIIGSIHGDEPEGLRALPHVQRAIEAVPAVTIRIIEDANPDGTAHGTRTNARGVDLNRNWPTANFAAKARHGTSPLSEPESRFLYEQIREFAPTLIIVYHSARNGPFVNFDGPAEQHAAAFAHAAAVSDPRWHVRPSMGYPTPGSLGTWAGVEQQIPILTVEFDRNHDPEPVEHAIVAGTLAVLNNLAQ